MDGGMSDRKRRPDAVALDTDRTGSDTELWRVAREAIGEAWEADKDNRDEASTDLAFLAGNQWPETVRRERERAGRPMLTINRLPQFVRQVTNDIRQADLAIKVSPEDDQSDPQLAKVYNGLLRQIQYQSSAKHVFSTAAEHQASCGIGWFRIVREYADDDAWDQELRIKLVRHPMSVYCDPGAIEPDRSDAMWIAVTEMVPRKVFKRRYPKAQEVSIDAPSDWSGRPFFWSTSDAVRVCEYYYKVPVERRLALLEGGETVDITDMGEAEAGQLPIVGVRPVKSHKVMMALVSGAEVLEGPFEEPGKHIPLVPVIGGEFPLEDKVYRYSVIRFARDPQHLYNVYRTATAEAIGLAPKAPYLATPEQIGPFKAMWDTANITNRPYLLYKADPQAPGGRPQREHPPEIPASLMQEAQIAADDMKGTTGIFDAALGQRSNETAGVAIRSRQAESDVANYHFVDNLHRSLEYCGRILIDLIPKVYDNERVIRLMGEDGTEEFQPINRVMMAIDGQPLVINDLSAGKFDVRVSIGRSYATKRMETADAMIEFMKAVPGSANVLGDLIAKALDFPEADVIAKRLKSLIPPAALVDPNDPNAPPPPKPTDDPMVQLDMRLKAADAELKEAQAEKARAEAVSGGAPMDGAQELPMNADPYEEARHRATARKAEADAEMAQLNAHSRRAELEAAGLPTHQVMAGGQSQVEMMQAMQQAVVSAVVHAMSLPKEIVRGPDGKAIGVRVVAPEAPVPGAPV
jgi:hypothetical protein